MSLRNVEYRYARSIFEKGIIFIRLLNKPYFTRLSGSFERQKYDTLIRILDCKWKQVSINKLQTESSISFDAKWYFDIYYLTLFSLARPMGRLRCSTFLLCFIISLKQQRKIISTSIALKRLYFLGEIVNRDVSGTFVIWWLHRAVINHSRKTISMNWLIVAPLTPFNVF